MNRYFKGAKEALNEDVRAIMFGSELSNGIDVVIKLPIGDKNKYEQLKNFQEITHKEAVEFSESINPME